MNPTAAETLSFRGGLIFTSTDNHYLVKLPLAISLAIAGLATAAEPLSLIPLPVSVKPMEGAFEFSAETAIRYDKDLESEATLFAADLAKRSGGTHETVREELRILLKSEIRIDLDPDADLPASGYTLNVSPQAVVITGKDAAGAYYGTRSILQLLPPEGDAAWKDDTPEKIPALEITDYPRFGWRGAMLDVARHFRTPDEVKKFIDWLAFHKLNSFHWHLTEDQGWRIEIKKYPKLTEIGAWRASTPPYGNRNSDDGERYGGFYTQEEIKDVVAYATARHVRVVPEIEMPGHAAAAIAAYPEIGNTDVEGFDPKVITRWGVHPYTFAPKDETFQFLEDVLTEVCELFPSKYIHIGGDEAPKTQWKNSAAAQEVMKREGLKNEDELQSWFIRRIAEFLKTKDRRLIGWDEIQEGGLPKDATMMVWRDAKWAKHALALGNDVVMGTTSHLYFDYYQAPAAEELAKGKEFESIGGFLPIEKVYSYNPTFVAETPAQEKQILGTQAQIWSEYLKTMEKVEYAAFPRLAALAEVAWTPLDRKNFEDFSARLVGIMKQYDGGGLNHYTPPLPAKRETKDGSTVETSLGIYQNHWAELAYDGRDDTFFWSNQALKKDDHLTLHLSNPLAAETPVSLVTGGSASRKGDALDAGVLEASTDGKSWTELGVFTDGKATGSAAAGTRHIRLRVTAPQDNWLIVSEISVGGE